MNRFENSREIEYEKIRKSDICISTMIFYFLHKMEKYDTAELNDIYNLDNGNKYRIRIERIK